jgi:membrane fusion protein (multidrug efflux system)
VEPDALTFGVESTVAGQVLSAALSVGQHVRRGDLLVQLDAAMQQLELDQERARAEQLVVEMDGRRSQINAEERTRAAEGRAAQLRGGEAAGRVREAQAAAEYAAVELARLEQLHERGLVSDLERDKGRSRARQQSAAVETAQSARRLVSQEQIALERKHDSRAEQLRAELAALEAQRTVSLAGGERIRYAIEQRSLRAPVDGVVGDCLPLRRGAVIAAGDRLATLIPEGRFRAVAQFPANRAGGRIRTGQSAMLRLDAFPWAEFGAVSATVARVATESREGSVTVELTLAPGASYRGPLQAGMPGEVDVEVERATPLELLLRIAGQALTAPQ